MHPKRTPRVQKVLEIKTQIIDIIIVIISSHH